LAVKYTFVPRKRSHYLIRNGIRLGMRLQSGPLRGQLTWRRPVLPTLNQMLHNPNYAGAYAYGRRREEPKAKAAGRHGRGQRWLPMSEWEVLLKDRLPAYIGWEQYLGTSDVSSRTARSPARRARRAGAWRC
jgi:hypothetical protein